ncbi:MAG: type II toxin-antitoxin system Phd/YefM family antitoxin [Mesorhizobium sp.]|nr:MAG: type II toxin-antitoxin system Phd/YefM family antitoxin [Mesorhizobium sp.]
MRDPVIITKNGRPRTVLLAYEDCPAVEARPAGRADSGTRRRRNRRGRSLRNGSGSRPSQ